MSVFGIDLGTCYSCVAICDDSGHIEVKTPLGQTEPTVPSVVSYNEEGTPFVGNAAKNRLSSKDESSIDEVKREMNQEYCNKELKIGGLRRKVSPAEISACVLRHLFYNANKVVVNQDRQPMVKKAVITIPAMYNDTQREKTKLAAEKAGIEVIGLLQEPTAAAISYNIKHGETILVFDLGGGTLDVSIVKNELGTLEVLGVPAGDLKLGGKDWDAALANEVVKSVGKDPNSIEHNKREWAKLMDTAERMKKLLSVDTEIEFEITLPGVYEYVPISRSKFETIATPLVKRALNVVDNAIKNAGNPAIDRFVLVGGSSRMPMIKRALEQKYSQKYSKNRKTDDWLVLSNPDLAIAMGAARYAGILSGTLRGMYSIIDKATHSYGFRCCKADVKDREELIVVNSIFSSDPMIISDRPFSLATRYDNSSYVSLTIIENASNEEEFNYSDEPVLVSENLSLPPNTPKGTSINMMINRDMNGIIHIDAECNGSRIEFKTKKKNEVSYSIIRDIENSIKKMELEEK